MVTPEDDNEIQDARDSIDSGQMPISGESDFTVKDEIRTRISQAQSAHDVLYDYEYSTYTGTPLMGAMLLFKYSPINRNQMYDVYPLVIPFTRTKSGFTGLNLHYLDGSTRSYFFDALQRINLNSMQNPNARIQFVWSMAKNLSIFSPAYNCVHSYRYSNLQSLFKIIEPSDWELVLSLPLEEFR